MKLVSKTTETKTVELTQIELHLLTSALGDYVHRALGLTNNHSHTDAVRALYSETVEIYCED
ncbi:MAG: hypothetical protein ACOVK2_02475 [Candidatus Fonsibacter sp.]